MAEINMNDYNTFDETNDTLEKSVEAKENAEYYLNNFISRIQGEGSIGKIRNEVYNFIYANTKMDSDTKKKLIELELLSLKDCWNELLLMKMLLISLKMKKNYGNLAL